MNTSLASPAVWFQAHYSTSLISGLFFKRNYNVSYVVNWEPQSYLDVPGNAEVLGFPRARH